MGFTGTLTACPISAHPGAICFLATSISPLCCDVAEEKSSAHRIRPHHGANFRIVWRSWGVEVLTLQPGRDTPKLGCLGFSPDQRYRRSLIKVGGVFGVQLLNLAQPLVMQQIFDRLFNNCTFHSWLGAAWCEFV